ncbi:radical SAM protein [SCandidatus Aminicenantes bacterium Aminicenantia_JdfR_composite]|jgi:putative pyruvate formate lyase activating enzyme|nr:radical SAM protein [SCandidatus Aminicenantes bacterium Aminicenantia_JdfR_composite]MCP2597750.1 radical SAM protein [Candidatus Aminicenantes bacterium AC-335-L06]
MFKVKEKIKKLERAISILSENERECRLCPRSCKVNRAKERKGFCKTGNNAIVAYSGLHFGEEPPISGYYDYPMTDKSLKKGSGTIFFTGCNLKCTFCQNYQISWEMKGREISDEELADLMLSLQDKKALNINLVSPTHLIIPILRALKIAYNKGLSIPVVYNSNAYESLEVIKNLNGIVDIYLPDLKYFNPETSEKYAQARDYFQVATKIIKEMYEQVGDLRFENGYAVKGLIIRHLVLPGHIKETFKILEWIYNNLSEKAWLSIMSQYKPCFKASGPLERKLRREEYEIVLKKVEDLGFENVFIQSEFLNDDEHLVPDFTKEEPFKWPEVRKDKSI